MEVNFYQYILDQLPKQDKQKKAEYNSEPIYFCKHCLSLKVMNESRLPDLEYCGECGSTNVDITDIDTWQKMYEKKYGFNYLKR